VSVFDTPSCFVDTLCLPLGDFAVAGFQVVSLVGHGYSR